jgi:CheY-like chemotaxis protein
VAAPAAEPDTSRMRVLVVEDDENALLVYDRMLRDGPYQMAAARTLRQAADALAQARPAAIVLDLALRGEQTWQWLSELKGNPATQAIPIVIVSTTEDQRKAFALGADAYLVKPIEREPLLAQLDAFTRGRVLLIDDDPAWRYTLRRMLDTSRCQVIEAVDGGSGLQAAQAVRPQVIVLDLGLPDIPGEEVLKLLGENPVTRGIPVVVATARELTPGEHATLARSAAAVLNKSDFETEIVPRVNAILNDFAAEAAT